MTFSKARSKARSKSSEVSFNWNVAKKTHGVASSSRLLKIYVSFAKEPYKKDDILQKRPVTSRSLLIVATPYELWLRALLWALENATGGVTGLTIGYGVATISRLLKIIGLFCRRTLIRRLYSAKETYRFKEPTNRSHPILGWRTG